MLFLLGVNRLTVRFRSLAFLLGKRRLGTVCFLVGSRNSFIAFQLFSHGRLLVCLLCRTRSIAVPLISELRSDGGLFSVFATVGFSWD